jgi:hypothetical protein
MSLFKPLVAASALALSIALPMTAAQAQEVPPPVLVTADENGNGSIQFIGLTTPMTAVQGQDPGPGGLSNALIYLLGAPNLVPGDVILSEGPAAALVPSDVIRFVTPTITSLTNVDDVLPSSIMVFYSDNGDGVDALADTGFPTAFFENSVTIAEVGPEGDNGAFYTPTANQPGFVPGFAVTYHFISDSAAPEPATWAMMLLGFGAVGFAVRRSRKKAAALLPA